MPLKNLQSSLYDPYHKNVILSYQNNPPAIKHLDYVYYI